MTDARASLEAITGPGVVAILRADRSDFFPQAVVALVSGGIRAIEVTLTTPGAISAITRIASDVREAVVGAGTVLTADDARAVLRAGARFIVSPIFAPEVVRIAKEAGALCIPGAFTPTEVFSAWQAGADLVKVFPAGLFGPRYLRYLRELFPRIRLFPTGGLSLNDVGDYLAAGAAAVGLGSNLADARALMAGDAEPLVERARALVNRIEQARRG
jgi:2-dehydro-3-deoxyphosphogluconate aldolase/(4S)-4-hydroxy-2-oxoglutarate aldolase